MFGLSPLVKSNNRGSNSDASSFGTLRFSAELLFFGSRVFLLHWRYCLRTHGHIYYSLFSSEVCSIGICLIKYALPLGLSSPRSGAVFRRTSWSLLLLFSITAQLRSSCYSSVAVFRVPARAGLLSTSLGFAS